MYVCVCNCVTDREIRACADLGCCTLDELRNHIGVASCCGRCGPTAEQLLRDHARERVGCEAMAGG